MIEQLLTQEFTDDARRWITIVFFWSGFAAWVGVLVSAIFRRGAFQRPWTAFCLGWIGVALGPVVARTLLQSDDFEPVSPAGLGAALLFSIATVLTYHVFTFLFPRRDLEEEELEEEENEDELSRLQDSYSNMSRDQLERALLQRAREEMAYEPRERGRR